MALTNDEVRHLAKLCRLALTDREVEEFVLQLSSILAYVGQLERVDVDVATEAIANASGLENVLRDDVVRPFSEEERQRILDQFPLRHENLLKTSGVFRK